MIKKICKVKSFQIFSWMHIAQSPLHCLDRRGSLFHKTVQILYDQGRCHSESWVVSSITFCGSRWSTLGRWSFFNIPQIVLHASIGQEILEYFHPTAFQSEIWLTENNYDVKHLLLGLLWEENSLIFIAKIQIDLSSHEEQLEMKWNNPTSL